jgi:hypothetical protein
MHDIGGDIDFLGYCFGSAGISEFFQPKTMEYDLACVLGTTPSRILSENELHVLVAAYFVFVIAVAGVLIYLMCLIS